MKYPYKHFDPSWVSGGPGPSLIRLFFQSQFQFINYLNVEYLNVVVPDSQMKKDPIFYANYVRNLSAGIKFNKFFFLCKNK